MPTPVVAPDGSPVDLYLQMPTFGEAEIVHDAVPPGSEILELGCGTGRMTSELVRLGHRVTAVDESAEMLAHVRDARTVRSRIEDLELDRRFEVVLMASNLVNEADAVARGRRIEACARHVEPAGRVVIQCYPPGWQPTIGTRAERGPVTLTVVEASRRGTRVTATVEYEIGERHWRHGPFTAEVLDEPAIAGLLAGVGLTIDRWLDEAHSWLVARRQAA